MDLGFARAMKNLLRVERRDEMVLLSSVLDDPTGNEAYRFFGHSSITAKGLSRQNRWPGAIVAP
jgi:hypothetical protein